VRDTEVGEEETSDFGERLEQCHPSSRPRLDAHHGMYSRSLASAFASWLLASGHLVLMSLSPHVVLLPAFLLALLPTCLFSRKHAAMLLSCFP
jgi:hypothetical protein